MERKSLRFILFMFIFIGLFIVLGIFLSRDQIMIERWFVHAELIDNGDLVIKEDLTYSFKKKYNGVYHRIDLNEIDGVSNISVFEVVDEVELPYRQVNMARKGAREVFTIDKNQKEIEIRIYSPVNKEQRTFRIEYIVNNVATRYKDTGELYYQFISHSNKTPVNVFEAHLKLPQPQSTDRMHAFVHGPRNAEITRLNDQTYCLIVSDVSKNIFVEARLLFPTIVIPNSNKIVPKDQFDEILKEEETYQQKLANEGYKSKVFGTISMIGGGMGILLLVVFGFRFSRRRKYEIDEWMVGIPDDCTPAVAATLMNRLDYPEVFPATILDLVRKGYLSIHGDFQSSHEINENIDQNYRLKLIRMPDEELLSHERLFLKWLFGEIGRGNYLAIEDLNQYVENDEDKFFKEYQEWRDEVTKNAVERGYYDRTKRKYGIFILLYSGFLLILGGIAASYENYWGGLAIVISFVLFFYSLSLFFRLTERGNQIQRQWKQFIRHIKEHDERWTFERYLYDQEHPSLIYALALGVKTKGNLQIKEILQQYRVYSNTWLFWYLLFIYYQPIDSITKSTSTRFGGYSGGGFTGGGAGGVSTGGF